ncbi:AAA+-type ATPase [Handroanthus impetiginosus]|uniref:AAA+-type ATPase n=1 Tax=Handroanthus impetiginosus TaxID=429701 RepID=A0A2G9HCW3_9LAMI|nr:AAA+-type ATPase [Handroanthus impetiginosus]
MITSMLEIMTQVGSAIAGLMVAYAMFPNYFPYEFRGPIMRYAQKLVSFLYPYVRITFPEYQEDHGFERSKAFDAIQRYLNKNSTKQAKRLQANVVRDREAIVLSMADHEEVADEYQGIKLWWSANQNISKRQTISFFPREDEKKYFKLTFHRRHRDIITVEYLKHVLDEGKAISVQERQRKLYTNNKSKSMHWYRRSMWSHVAFEHPATFDTLAMDRDKKQEIVNDLINFSTSKDYYAKIGKAWKRGYLLFGPPGTGKSTMIAAMANLLKYDVYDLELTTVKDNTELRKLLIDTSSKSIIVIEDIDCSLDLTGQREKKKDKEEDDDKKKDEKKDPVKEKMKKMEENKNSQVTLSGLLNFIDGLWSACGSERIIVFTTNYVEKLDPALIRRGRMDKHIELSYCSFEAFKVLAKNYLDVYSHDLFAEVGRLLEETSMTPADVAENLMPKSSGEDAKTSLMRLIKALEEAKEEARRKAEEEEKQKAEKLAKEEEEERKKLEKEKEKENGLQSSENGNQSLSNGAKENGEATNVENTENANGAKESGEPIKVNDTEDANGVKT